jgi:leucyl-tRNA synthetase
MTAYGDRLADDLKDTDFMPHIKTSQINWIGKSEGVEVDFDIVGGGKFSIFTTCIETICGITFMVVAPESDIVENLKDRIENLKNWSKQVEYSEENTELLIYGEE